MQIKSGMEKDYQDWLEKNSHDPYSLRCFTYADEWATMLEKQIESDKESATPTQVVEKYADHFSHLADTDGITGFMYGCAVSILARAWVYGEDLRLWHNLKTQVRNEGERANKEGGVLNPALLRVDVGRRG